MGKSPRPGKRGAGMNLAPDVGLRGVSESSMSELCIQILIKDLANASVLRDLMKRLKVQFSITPNRKDLVMFVRGNMHTLNTVTMEVLKIDLEGVEIIEAIKSKTVFE